MDDTFPIKIKYGYWRNPTYLTPNIAMIEHTYAKTVTAKTIWHLRLIKRDGEIVGETRNTRKWGAQVIEASVHGIPDAFGYPSGKILVDPANDVIAVRFLTALAKEFWP